MTEHNDLVERLSLQSESFQEGFEFLSRAASFKELAIKFLHLLKGNLILNNLSVFCKSEVSADWDEIKVSPKFDRKDLLYFEINTTLKCSYFNNEKYSASIVLPLSDLSYLGILIGGKLDGTPFNDFDKITLQVLLQVFNSAHKSF